MKTNHTAEIEVDLKCSALDTTFLLAALLCAEFSHEGGIFKSNFHLHPDDEPHEVIVKTAYLEVENGNHIDAIETWHHVHDQNSKPRSCYLKLASSLKSGRR